MIAYTQSERGKKGTNKSRKSEQHYLFVRAQEVKLVKLQYRFDPEDGW
jgi:hypothetical protein